MISGIGRVLVTRCQQNFLCTASVMDSSSFIKSGANQVRNYKAGINIEWVRPPNIHCTDPSKSGDRSSLPSVDTSRPKFQAENLENLSQASDVVKKVLSLEFAPHRKHVQAIKHDLLKQIQRHKLDHASMESTIACLTTDIRNIQKHISKHKTDRVSRHFLKEMIEQRKSFLKHLRHMDYKRFEWVLEKLDLVYHANPYPVIPVTRKGSIEQLTTIHCDTVRQKRLEAYKEELERQKLEFAKEKEETLAWISREETELGLSNSNS